MKRRCFRKCSMKGIRIYILLVVLGMKNLTILFLSSRPSAIRSSFFLKPNLLFEKKYR